MTRTPEEVLREAQTRFALMVQHAQGNLDDQLVIDATCMRLSAGVEALARPDTATREAPQRTAGRKRRTLDSRPIGRTSRDGNSLIWRGRWVRASVLLLRLSWYVRSTWLELGSGAGDRRSGGSAPRAEGCLDPGHGHRCGGRPGRGCGAADLRGRGVGAGRGEDRVGSGRGVHCLQAEQHQ